MIKSLPREVTDQVTIIMISFFIYFFFFIIYNFTSKMIKRMNTGRCKGNNQTKIRLLQPKEYKNYIFVECGVARVGDRSNVNVRNVMSV